MKIKGNAKVVRKQDGNGNDINTDYIISGRYKFKTEDMNELAKYIFEDIAPGFYGKMKKGDIVVAGKNFGCGSSREQAPLALIAAGVGAVVSKSFARIFYRNGYNNGLPLVECNTDGINENDELELDLEEGVLRNLTQGKVVKVVKLPQTMLTLLNDGGLVRHLTQHGGFKV
ncbi:MAG: 3-isopropylmalate dehydratase [Elusimicrobiota bacterium]